MDINIRLMCARDLAAVAEIQAEAYAGYFVESATVIAQRFYASPATAWVAVDKGQVCAYLVGYWSMLGKINPLNAAFFPAENPDCLYLHDLALLNSAQGKGMAKKLIGAATELARNSCAQAMALLSVQDSKDFWRAFGFSEAMELELAQQENLDTYLTEDQVAFYMVKPI